MRIFIDFDDVIFNTRSFRNDFQDLFSRSGIPAEIFQKNYYNYEPNFADYPARTYSPEKHLEMIGREFTFDKLALQKSIQEFLQDTRKYIFSDVEPFLKRFDLQELFLISHGNPAFQKNKITNSGIDRYFSAVEISQEGKSQEIKKNIDKTGGFQEAEKYFFLDDRAHYIEEVKKNLPNVVTFLIQRKEGRYRDPKNASCDFSAKDLPEAWQIISQLGRG